MRGTFRPLAPVSPLLPSKVPTPTSCSLSLTPTAPSIGHCHPPCSHQIRQLRIRQQLSGLLWCGSNPTLPPSRRPTASSEDSWRRNIRRNIHVLIAIVPEEDPMRIRRSSRWTCHTPQRPPGSETTSLPGEQSSQQRPTSRRPSQPPTSSSYQDHLPTGAPQHPPPGQLLGMSPSSPH